MLGNIRFIGELGKLGLVRESILHACIKKLLERKQGASVEDMAEDLECLCYLVKTIGRRLDTDKAKAWMDRYFDRISSYISNSTLPARIRFSLQDVIELRENNWEPRRVLKENGPKTIAEVRHEVAKELGWSPHPVAPFMSMPPMYPQGDLFHPVVNGGGPLGDMFYHPSSPPIMGGMGTGPGVIPMESFRPKVNPTGWGRGYMKDRGGFNKGNVDSRFPRPPMNNYKPSRSDDDDTLDSDDLSGGGSDNRLDYQPPGRISQRGHGLYGGHSYQARDPDSHTGDAQNGPGPRGKPVAWQSSSGQGGRPNPNASLAQKDLDKLPPRFRKKLELQNQCYESSSITSAPSGNSNLEVPFVASVPAYHMGNGILKNPQSAVPPTSNTPSPPSHPPTGQVLGSKEEISLRPVRMPTFRPNIPSMLPRSAQVPVFRPSEATLLTSTASKTTVSNVLAPPGVAIKTVSSDKLKDKKKSQPSNEEVNQQLISLLQSLWMSEDIEKAVTACKQLKPPKRFLPRLVKTVILESIEHSDGARTCAAKLLQKLKTEAIVDEHRFMEGFSGVLDQLKSLETVTPCVKSYVSCLAAALIENEVVHLKALCVPLKGGRHYPLILLILQQLLKLKGQEWLSKALQDSQLDLQEMLPECDRKRERMMEILEERGLGFLFPLLRLQLELWTQLQADPSPTSLYKWLKDRCEPAILSTPDFIHLIYTNVLKYVTNHSTLKQSTDKDDMPDKILIGKEKELLTSFKPLLQVFVDEKSLLQLEAIYAVQVFCDGSSFPKGMILRMFMNLYDLEIIEEEAFLQWKEHINNSYPGKGKALFQVNQWLSWLEQAESESSDED